jgi:HK97 family phage major capsid protein
MVGRTCRFASGAAAPPYRKKAKTKLIMRKLLKPYRQLSYLLTVIILSIALFAIHLVSGPGAFFIVGAWQILAFARSKKYGACYTSVGLTPEQIKEFDGICKDLSEKFGDFAKHIPGLKDLSTVEGGFAAIKKLPDIFKGEQKRVDEMHGELQKLRKAYARTQTATGVRWVGNVPFVTDDCARALTSIFVLETAALGEAALRQLNRASNTHEGLIAQAREFLGIETKTALTTTQIPVPTVYVPQIIELIFRYGQARQYATVFPLGAGVVKLPRLAAGEDDFGFLGVGTAGMSQSVTERRVTAELVTFTANKAGGLIRIPTELEEDTFIPLGQFLARYIARQLAKLEDKTMFLGDGGSTYANCTGVGPYCTTANGYLQQLAAGKTKPTDATLNDFRYMRTLVSAAVLANMGASGQLAAAYYLHPTMEALLVTFNTIGAPLVYRPQQGSQPATLDGFPIRWIGVSQAYSTKAAAAAYLAFFGDLSYWYLGERGSVRVEVSKEVFFATDELAMRALERIDVEAMAIDAMSALETAAA